MMNRKLKVAGRGVPRRTDSFDMFGQMRKQQMAQQGKFYYIKSNFSGLVVDAEGGSVHPGVRLVTTNQKQGAQAASQLFYTDVATGTIRSKTNDYCIDIMSDTMALNLYQPGNGSQEWNITGTFITNKKNPALAIDIKGNSRTPGSRLTIWNYEGKANQQWTIEYQKAQYFQLQSDMNKKVLDIAGASKNPGTAVVMWSRPSGDQKPDNQLWYEDQTGVIRSKLHNFALDASGGSIVVNPYSVHNMKQQWILQGNRVVNRNTNEVLDISAKNANDGAGLCAFQYKAQPNQHWQAVYI